MRAVDVSSFAESQLSLLSAELAAETASTTLLLSSTSPKTLARAGLAITNLTLTALRTGLGGKTVLELEQDHAVGNNGELGEHGIRVGDIVKVDEQPKGGEKTKKQTVTEARGSEGVVIRVGNKGVQIAVEDGSGVEDALNRRLWVVKLANDVTYKRMNQAMEKLKKMEERDYTTLTRVLFGLESVNMVSEGSSNWPRDVKFFDSTLNESQEDAVRFALASREVALIHGPPGTGKTYTLVELIRQLVDQSQRVLVCGPSNISVDNIVERLAPHKLPILRLGHPARLLPSVLSHSLDVLTQTSEAASIVKDVRKEMDAKQASIKKTRNGRERRTIYGDLKELRKEYREREKQCVTSLVGGSKVVLATLHGAGGFQLRNEQFDVVIIDEASQALEAQCWVPLLSAKKVVLAGDHLQLPPTITSSAADRKKISATNAGKKDNKQGQSSKEPATKTSNESPSLETTLFDRLLTLHGPGIKRMLTTQYRMHELIMRFPSSEMYEGRLLAAPSVSQRLLTTLTYQVADTDDTREPLIFYDTQGGDFPESSTSDTTNSADSDSKPSQRSLLTDSKSNAMEAALAARHVAAIVDAGVREADIAIITPYNGQVSLLSALLRHRYPALELGSVDGFQGREKEAVILSLVRSNADKMGKAEVGFLGEKRRLNVAMTRPRRQLCVIGDAETVGRGSGFLKSWMEFLEREADLRYPDVAELQKMD